MIAAFVHHEYIKCSAYNLSHMEFLATDKFLVIQEHKIMDEKNSLQNHSLFSSHFSKEKKGVLIYFMDYSVSSLQLHQCNDCSALAYMYSCFPFQTVQSEDTPGSATLKRSASTDLPDPKRVRHTSAGTVSLNPQTTK